MIILFSLSDHVIRVGKSISYTTIIEGDTGRHCSMDGDSDGLCKFCLNLSNDDVLGGAVRLGVGTPGNEESKIALGKPISHVDLRYSMVFH